MLGAAREDEVGEARRQGAVRASSAEFGQTKSGSERLKWPSNRSGVINAALDEVTDRASAGSTSAHLSTDGARTRR